MKILQQKNVTKCKMWQNLKLKLQQKKIYKCGKLKISHSDKNKIFKCDKTSKLKIYLHPKKIIVAKVKEVYCDKTQKHQLW